MQASPASLVKANFSLLGLHEYLPFSQFDDILNFSSEDIVCLANGCRHISWSVDVTCCYFIFILFTT
jgi:hypothetical protein